MSGGHGAQWYSLQTTLESPPRGPGRTRGFGLSSIGSSLLPRFGRRFDVLEERCHAQLEAGKNLAAIERVAGGKHGELRRRRINGRGLDLWINEPDEAHAYGKILAQL